MTGGGDGQPRADLDGSRNPCYNDHSGETGLERAVLAQPDLIVLGVQMPGLDSSETCRRLKAAATTRDIPVIFTTAVDERTDKE